MIHRPKGWLSDVLDLPYSTTFERVQIKTTKLHPYALSTDDVDEKRTSKGLGGSSR